MKGCSQLPLFFTLLLVFPPAAMSDVKVSLTNGKEVIADSCRETGGRLIKERELLHEDVQNYSVRYKKMKKSTISNYKMQGNPSSFIPHPSVPCIVHRDLKLFKIFKWSLFLF